MFAGRLHLEIKSFFSHRENHLQHKSANVQLATASIQHLISVYSCLSTGIIHVFKRSLQSLKWSMKRSRTKNKVFKERLSPHPPSWEASPERQSPAQETEAGRKHLKLCWVSWALWHCPLLPSPIPQHIPEPRAKVGEQLLRVDNGPRIRETPSYS